MLISSYVVYYNYYLLINWQYYNTYKNDNITIMHNLTGTSAVSLSRLISWCMLTLFELSLIYNVQGKLTTCTFINLLVYHICRETYCLVRVNSLHHFWVVLRLDLREILQCLCSVVINTICVVVHNLYITKM